MPLEFEREWPLGLLAIIVVVVVVGSLVVYVVSKNLVVYLSLYLSLRFDIPEIMGRRSIALLSKK